MFGLSFEHLLVILGLVLLFKPERVFQLARAFGKGIRGYREAKGGIIEPEFQRLEVNGQNDNEKVK